MYEAEGRKRTGERASALTIPYEKTAGYRRRAAKPVQQQAPSEISPFHVDTPDRATLHAAGHAMRERRGVVRSTLRWFTAGLRELSPRRLRRRR